MIRQGLAAALLFFPAPSVTSEGLTLRIPVVCVAEDGCYIQQYMDRAPGPGWRDYMCSTLSYNRHSGTDFAVPNRAIMNRGVDVIAAAPGIVRGTRDGMPDTGWTAATAALVGSRPCGNGLVIDHHDNWATQYCHLKEGSIQVEKGQSVNAGDVLGQIGQSGRAEFPHVHFTVRKHDVPIDPFDPDGVVNCAAPADSSLWIDPPPYQPGGVIDLGMTTQMPSYEDVKAGHVGEQTATPDASAIILYGVIFGGRIGDILRLSVQAPEGNQIAMNEAALSANQAMAFRALGTNLRPGRQWQHGNYIGRVTLLRGREVVSERTQTLVIE
ncbi:MAG: M23 family metallopeptidase [Pseudomonadota bacterium]